MEADSVRILPPESARHELGEDGFDRLRRICRILEAGSALEQHAGKQTTCGRRRKGEWPPLSAFLR